MLNRRHDQLISITVDLVIFTSFYFCEFKKLAKMIIIIALLKKNENSRVLSFVKNPQKLPDLQWAGALG